MFFIIFEKFFFFKCFGFFQQDPNFAFFVGLKVKIMISILLKKCISENFLRKLLVK